MKFRHIPHSVRESVYLKYGGHCAYCGCEIKPGGMKMDHFINRQGNVYDIKPCCNSCYSLKANDSVEKFRSRIQQIPERIRRENPIYSVGERYGVIGRKKETIEFYFEKEERIELS